MATYGAKASLPGYDVKSIFDYLLAFNSSWPLLKIEASGTAVVSLNGTPQTIHTHNLGYLPMYLLISNDIVASAGIFDVASGLNKGVGVSTSILGYDGSNSSGGTYTFRYYIFRLPLATAFQAPIVVGGTTQGSQVDDYGIKVTKPGKDISSTDLRDFTLHSGTRSPMLQTVDYGLATTLTLGYLYRTVTHNLGYTPLAFSFIKWASNTLGYNNSWAYLIPPPIGVTPADYTVSSTNVVSRVDVTYTNLQIPDFATVILKDPFTKQVISRSFP